jgi:transcription termination/antitermination protein NusG
MADDTKKILEQVEELQEELEAEPVVPQEVPEETTQAETVDNVDDQGDAVTPQDEANPEVFDPAAETPAEDSNLHIEGGVVDAQEAEVESAPQPELDQDEPAEPQDEAKLTERGGGSKNLQGHIVITKKDDANARWYVVHTTSGHEARIAENLRQRVETMGLQENVLEILIPTQDRVVIRGGKKYTVKEKIFPGYMIVKMILTDEAWLCVRTTQGVTGFVGAGNKPSPLSDMEVQNITKFVAAPAARYKVRFTVGEAVRITDGPFSQFLGTINEMDEERGKVKVLVSIFGRETPVELDFLQIAKV